MSGPAATLTEGQGLVPSVSVGHINTILSRVLSSTSLTVFSPAHTFSPKFPPSSQHLAEEKENVTDLTLCSKSSATFSLWFPLWLFLSMPSFSMIHSFVLSMSTVGGPTLGC